MTLTSAQPELYSVDDSGTPVLKGLTDPDGNVFFPFQQYGSEATGAYGDQLTAIDLAGTGTVTARAEVHHHPSADIPTPFTVAAIELDEGPLIRGVLADGVTASVGDRVQAITVVVDRGEVRAAELRFALASKEQP
ncbi:OB-fold domain-containing protein [Williamsia sp. CHRR-6]|uniref:OB-fold domain-containing protein n=1 Tax=Williamsia sp. CHRR-6 TaxID=2835871 RepID=UPI001BD9A7CD|nr:OB-fold domain-containing protein [Williamsia sp. CHRR-6]MBT0566837.1 OB-fold domain-containing protein [Williamsia sp. CHRR-6]